MTYSRPEVFISAITKDLGTCRKIIKEALITIECSPVEQTNFRPNAGTVREMLRKRIARCQAVIHLVGEVYGVEPQVQSKGKSRRSYTQMEYDIARELEIPVYIFICANGFPYDSHPAEGEEKRILQQLHRDKLSSLDALYEEINSRDVLEKRILALPIGVEQLSNELDAVQNELENQRTIVRILADSNTRLQAEMAELELTDAEIFNRAMTSTAERAGIAVPELISIIDLFVSAVRSNPGADFIDLALVDFAEKKFTSAASNAGLAANEAHARRIAAEELVTHAANEVIAAKAQEREARKLEGQAFYAEKYFEEAIQAFEKALAITSQSELPKSWADLYFNIGLAFNNLATISSGDDFAKNMQLAIDAYKAALQVYSRKLLPQGWAATQNNLAIALKELAQTAEGNKRDQLLAEAVTAYRSALEVRKRSTLPQEWAQTQNNLGIVLRDRALGAHGEKCNQLLTEAIVAYRAALEERTREKFPVDWAASQNNLALALWSQSKAAVGKNRDQLLAEAVVANRAALEVRTRVAVPQDWAQTQHNLGIVLSDQALGVEGKMSGQLLADAVAAYRSALEVRTQRTMPLDWASTTHQTANSM